MKQSHAAATTVLNRNDLDRVVDAGARFVVSPGIDSEVVEGALERDVAVLPGVATASEVQLAVRFGLSTAKFFPAEAMGGLRVIHALAGPFPDFRFVPSGAITLENASGYLRDPAVAAVSGSWMLPSAALTSGDFAATERLCRQTAQRVRTAGAHS